MVFFSIKSQIIGNGRMVCDTAADAERQTKRQRFWEKIFFKSKQIKQTQILIKYYLPETTQLNGFLPV